MTRGEAKAGFDWIPDSESYERYRIFPNNSDGQSAYSTERAELSRRLQGSGWREEKAEEAVRFSTGESISEHHCENITNGKLYAFTSEDAVKRMQADAIKAHGIRMEQTDIIQRSPGSPYWLTEGQYNNLRQHHFGNGQLDANGLKNKLSLPCYNRADTVVSIEYTGKVRTTRTAAVIEEYHLRDDGGQLVKRSRELKGGAEQALPSKARMGSTVKIEKRFSNVLYKNQRKEEQKSADAGLITKASAKPVHRIY